jgi:hypothetical protein
MRWGAVLGEYTRLLISRVWWRMVLIALSPIAVSIIELIQSSDHPQDVDKPYPMPSSVFGQLTVFGRPSSSSRYSDEATETLHLCTRSIRV